MENKLFTKDNIIGFCVYLLPILIIIGLMIAMWIVQDWNEISHLENEIKYKQNVSGDYIRGWNDCINELRSLRATNVTNASSMFIKPCR